jgi:hypothetical protein
MTRDARELIRDYRESEWRSTRLKVLRHLADFQDSRSFHFLTQIIQNEEDLAEQQIAIASLARRKSVASRIFLRNFYSVAPDTLKVSLAHALGTVQDLASIPLLMRDWDIAISKQDFAWLRNILLSFGELKAFVSLPKILSFLQEQNHQTSNELLFAAIFSLGRLSRHPLELQNAIESHQERIIEDALLSQVYQSALSQVQVRSQFKLEDYLNKVFTLHEPHPVLPLELLSFDPEEVDLGLSLFSIDQQWKRLLFALRGVLPERREFHLVSIAETLKAIGDLENYYDFFEGLRDLGITPAIKSKIELVIQPQNLSPELKLKWLEVDGSFENEANFFLKHTSDEMAIRWINGWNEDWNGKLLSSNQPAVSVKVDAWLQAGCSVPVHARLIRACAELGLILPSILKNFSSDFKKTALRSSLLLYLEKHTGMVSPDVLAESFAVLTPEEKDALALRMLAVLEVYASEKKWVKEFEPLLKSFYDHFNVEIRAALIRVLARAKINEEYLLKQLGNEHEPIVLNAIISLKAFSSSSEAGDALVPFLGSHSMVLRGRALDALCENASLKSKQAVMKYLELHLDDEDAVDKIYRCFDPLKKGGEAFVKQLEEILKRNPDHAQWEKLVQLRERLLSHTPSLSGVDSMKGVGPEALKELDHKLSEVIPMFSKLDPTVQSALRAAEQPFHQSTDLQNLPVDKAPTVLEYCKALDLILERHLGQKYLFPKLDQNLHQFQTLWHHLGFSEDYPAADKVLNSLGLKGKITPENFPLHKSKMMCTTFFNGKITQDRFKIFDGLRSWAVIFLLFARKIPQVQGTPLLSIGKNIDAATMNEQCILIAKKLMTLQDLRNPAAHRQTYTELQLVTQVRNEAIQLVNTVLTLVL